MALTKTRKIGKIINGKFKISTVFDSDRIDSSSTKGVYITPTTLVVATTDDLPATSFNGKKALVTSTNSSYMYNNGWYKLNLSNRFSPYWITEPDSEYTLDLTSIDSDVKIVVLAFDSDDVPIAYSAVVDSDFNVSATISHDSDKDNIWIIRRRDSDSGAGTTGNVTFKASDGVNLTQKVVAFITSANTTYEFLGTLESVYSGTVLNLDSDMESLLTAGDVLTNAIGGSGAEATISSVSFLDNTYASRTFTGNTTGADQGSGNIAVPTGNVDSDNIGWVWNYNSANTTAASNFRTGNQFGGQIISNLNELPATWVANTTNLSSMYVHGAVDGSYYRSFEGVVCTQYSLTTNGGSSRKGTVPIHATNQYEVWSPYSNGQKNGSDHFISMKVDGLVSSNQGVNYQWPVPSYTSNWTARTVSIRSNNNSNIGGGTSMQTSMAFDGNQTSNFPVGGLVHIGESGSANAPTAEEVYQGKFFIIVMTCYFSQSVSSPFNMSTSSTQGTVSKWSGAFNNSYYFGTRANAGQTGIILAGNMGYNQSSIYGSSLATSLNANGMNQSVTMYVRSPNLCNEVYIISPDYPGTRFTQAAQDFRPSYSEWSSTNNASGASFGTSPYPIYKRTADASTQLQLNPSPAGDGTNVNIGTSVYGSYMWKNVTSTVVDDTTGFTAGDNIYKKIG